MANLLLTRNGGGGRRNRFWDLILGSSLRFFCALKSCVEVWLNFLIVFEVNEMPLTAFNDIGNSSVGPWGRLDLSILNFSYVPILSRFWFVTNNRDSSPLRKGEKQQKKKFATSGSLTNMTEQTPRFAQLSHLHLSPKFHYAVVTTNTTD